jgi:hypothetical protein
MYGIIREPNGESVGPNSVYRSVTVFAVISKAYYISKK